MEQKLAEALVSELETITDADLADPRLSAEFVERIKRNDTRYEGYEERREMATARKAAKKEFASVIKKIAPGYIAQSADGTLTPNRGKVKRDGTNP